MRVHPSADAVCFQVLMQSASCPRQVPSKYEYISTTQASALSDDECCYSRVALHALGPPGGPLIQAVGIRWMPLVARYTLKPSGALDVHSEGR